MLSEPCFQCVLSRCYPFQMNSSYFFGPPSSPEDVSIGFLTDNVVLKNSHTQPWKSLTTLEFLSCKQAWTLFDDRAHRWNDTAEKFTCAVSLARKLRFPVHQHWRCLAPKHLHKVHFRGLTEGSGKWGLWLTVCERTLKCAPLCMNAWVPFIFCSVWHHLSVLHDYPTR